jgi:ribonucleoside-diphosphate reductase alpha chain
LCKLLSGTMRHNLADNEYVNYLVMWLEKTGESFNNMPHILARCLRKWVKQGTRITGEVCPQCGGMLVRKEGCRACENHCGYSLCN